MGVYYNGNQLGGLNASFGTGDKIEKVIDGTVYTVEFDSQGKPIYKAGSNSSKILLEGDISKLFSFKGSITAEVLMQYEGVVPIFLQHSEEGYVYNIANNFVTNDDFVEGSGKTYKAGTNVVCVTIGGIKKWDALTGIISGGGSDVEIVDNLTSDDPTKALSAKQGKVLKGQIDELSQSFVPSEASVDTTINTLYTDIGSNVPRVSQGQIKSIQGATSVIRSRSITLSSGNITYNGNNSWKIDLADIKKVSSGAAVANLKLAGFTPVSSNSWNYVTGTMYLQVNNTRVIICNGSSTNAPTGTLIYETNELYGKLVNSRKNLISIGRNIWDEQWEQGYFDDETGEPVSATTCFRSKNYIPVKENTTYYIKKGGKVFYYDANKNLILSEGKDYSTFTTPSGTAFIKFYCYAQYGSVYTGDIIIAESSTPVEYEPYVSDEVTIDIVLRQAGNTRDEISNGKLITRVDNVGYGSSQVSGPTTYTNVLYFSIPKPENAKTYGGFTENGLSSNKFTPMRNIYGWDDARNIGGIFQSAQNNAYWIGFPVGTTLNEAKEAIEGLQINYELKNPEVSDIVIPNEITIYKNGSIRQSNTRTNSGPYNLVINFDVNILDQVLSNIEIDKIQKEKIKSLENKFDEPVKDVSTDHINMELLGEGIYLVSVMDIDDDYTEEDAPIYTFMISYLPGHTSTSYGSRPGDYYGPYLEIDEYNDLLFHNESGTIIETIFKVRKLSSSW